MSLSPLLSSTARCNPTRPLRLKVIPPHSRFPKSPFPPAKRIDTAWREPLEPSSRGKWLPTMIPRGCAQHDRSARTLVTRTYTPGRGRSASSFRLGKAVPCFSSLGRVCVLVTHRSAAMFYILHINTQDKSLQDKAKQSLVNPHRLDASVHVLHAETLEPVPHAITVGFASSIRQIPVCFRELRSGVSRFPGRSHCQPTHPLL